MAPRGTGSMLHRIALWEFSWGRYRGRTENWENSSKKKPHGAPISNTEKNMTDFLSIKTQKTFKFKILAISYPVLFNFIVKTKGTHLIRYSSLSVLLVQYCLSASESRDNAVTDGAKSVKFLAGSDK